MEQSASLLQITTFVKGVCFKVHGNLSTLHSQIKGSQTVQKVQKLYHPQKIANSLPGSQGFQSKDLHVKWQTLPTRANKSPMHSLLLNADLQSLPGPLETSQPLLTCLAAAVTPFFRFLDGFLHSVMKRQVGSFPVLQANASKRSRSLAMRIAPFTSAAPTLVQDLSQPGCASLPAT